MSLEKLTHWQYSRYLAGKIYYDWINKNGFIDLLSRPETIPSIFYQKRWDAGNQDIVEGILQFLVSLSILHEAGGTYSMSERSQNQVQIINSIDENKRHPTYLFLTYGLKLLDLKLEGDAGVWDVVRKNFLLELGFTQAGFLEFGNVTKYLKGKEDPNFTLKLNEKSKILIFSNFISSSIYSLIQTNNELQDITILTHDLTYKDRAITFCELETRTSSFSNKIFDLSEFNKGQQFDLIIIPNSLGFNSTFKEQLSLCSTVSHPKTMLYIYAATEANYGLGLEPIYYLHPNYKGVPNTSEFLRQAKSVGWVYDLRVGENKEILLLRHGR